MHIWKDTFDCWDTSVNFVKNHFGQKYMCCVSRSTWSLQMENFWYWWQIIAELYFSSLHVFHWKRPTKKLSLYPWDTYADSDCFGCIPFLLESRLTCFEAGSVLNSEAWIQWTKFRELITEGGVYFLGIIMSPMGPKKSLQSWKI